MAQGTVTGMELFESPGKIIKLDDWLTFTFTKSRKANAHDRNVAISSWKFAGTDAC
jgi:hypothetical protein